MRDPSRWLINGIMLIGVSLPSLFFIIKATYSEHYRYAIYESGATLTTATLDSAWKGEKCTKGSCVDRFYVKYSFTADRFPGETFFYVGQNFSSSNATYDRQRDESAIDIQKYEWIAAQQTGKIAVSYAQSNPWANDPYGQREQHDPTTTWILLSLMFTGLLGFGVFSLHKYRVSRLQI